MSGALLLTGGTGFLGTEVLARHLQHSDRPVIALVRAPDDAAAQRRIDTVVAGIVGSTPSRRTARVEGVAADMTAPSLGLPWVRVQDLAERVSTIIHSAASISFTLPLAEAREINVEGTRRMLEFAELAQARGGLDCYAHVSTAYVAGSHRGRFSEADLDVGQAFHNTYEQTKYEAERLVRSRSTLPFTVVRPSIVVGDRRSGWTATFNVLYWPLRALARGLFTVVPAVPSAPLDVVSVDYVADAIHELCGPGRSGSGATYHLTAGAQSSTIGEITLLASHYFRQPLPEVLPPAEFATHEHAAALEGASAYFPYFSYGAEFDDAASRARLEPAGISVSPLREYLERLLDYATRARWGKRPIARTEAFAAFAA
ncbi:MAG: SDR family oxidoreductase [Solirubrobacterales bacterium]|nr:SDR family oxidoreductase [Solirubrobacterales bacterium]MBV9717206.1 SDR family oxidoreductase [Solirubrobacterales bacterium]